MAHDTHNELTVTTHSPQQTQAVGRALGKAARAGDVYLLTGELGAGKTCLTQGILWGLGGDEYARSPTFVLICEYRARLTLYHMDLYRLDSFDEIIDLGLDEYIFGEGVCVVEWADKALDAFPAAHIGVDIWAGGGDRRALTVTAGSPEYARRLAAISAALAADMPLVEPQTDADTGEAR